MTNVVDSLATSAVYEMGEGNESQPLAIITEVKVDFCDTVDKTELCTDIYDDMYAPIFEYISHKDN